LDATFDTKELIPEEVAKSKRYKSFSGYSVQEVVDQIKADYGTIDYLVHSLANGPEVTKPLLETTRAGYLAASSASAYSLVSMVSRFAPIMNPGKCSPHVPCSLQVVDNTSTPRFTNLNVSECP
jgi:enoyl-[acyl-carrier protein] reductase I